MARKTVGSVLGSSVIVLCLAGLTLHADTAAGMAAFKRGDYQTALKEWRAASDAGSAEAQYDLGLLYAKGFGVPRDLTVAQQWYETAAAKGNTQAEFSLGQMYAKGWGIPRDEASALAWLDAADGNQSTTDFTWMPIEGYGQEPDYAKAAYWYRLAADKGHAEAEYDLAGLYSDGNGVPRDQTQAFELVKKSAMTGFLPAQVRVAWRYANGRGVEKSDSEAFFWYTVAARHGDKQAEKARIGIAKMLPPPQINEAETKAVSWKPAAPKK